MNENDNDVVTVGTLRPVLQKIETEINNGGGTGVKLATQETISALLNEIWPAETAT